MYEYTANFHQHTTVSDGSATHSQVIQAGIEAGLNVMIFTDHNVYVPGEEGWHKNTLALMGIEVNDIRQIPEHSHYLCLGVDRDLDHLSGDPQALIDAVNNCGGVGFIAHPFERPAPLFGEYEIPWRHWQVTGYTGFEIWNYMSEFKSHLTSKPKALWVAMEPDRFINGPFPETLARWDELTAAGQKVVAIGGSDAHALSYTMGPVNRVLFPYDYLFRAVRTHLLTKEPLSRDTQTAKPQVLDCLRRGHCFVANDLPADSTGFRFEAATSAGLVVMQGDEVSLAQAQTLELNVSVPSRAEIRLVRNGQELTRRRAQSLVYRVTEPGAYRVACYRAHKAKWLGWIFSNPIYVRA